ncbi:MAG: CinA family protein [Candidatus Omnitrophica bacterium]|nr:CinA family protein [Candidatus Omnitrophota bacterium]
MKTIAVAESCTGGLISHLITNKAGSSQYFKLGVVVYSNEAKISLLKIPSKIIEQFGSVSSQVALLMARQIRKLAKTDIGLGITGIAGPALPKLPKDDPLPPTRWKWWEIGLVYIAVSSVKGNECKKFNFSGSRKEIKEKAAKQALKILEIAIKQEENV